jgi:hypothetical protein
VIRETNADSLMKFCSQKRYRNSCQKMMSTWLNYTIKLVKQT